MDDLKPVTSPEAYQNNNQRVKTITLPSEAIFQIRKITGRDYIREGGLMISNTREIVSESAEKNQIIWNKMTAEQKLAQLKTNDRLVVLGVVSPQLSVEKCAGKLAIEDLTDDDYFFLLKEITEWSYGRQDIKSFRSEPGAADTGSDSETLRDTPIGTA